MNNSLEDTIAQAQAQQPVGSPCTNICRLSLATGYCDGCFRTRDEIKRWKTLSDAERLSLLQVLTDRRA